jgi:imipenem/basic amino acid-specific outer membrane pore
MRSSKITLLCSKLSLILCFLFTVELQAEVSGDLRAFWFDGQRDLRTDRTSLSVGGILSYETQEYYNLQASASFFTSHGITPLTKMPESGATNNLQSDGSAIDVLGEAALSYRWDKTVFKYGRQRMNTPLINDYYNRMLPNSFEGFSIENSSFGMTKIEAAYITGWKYKDSVEFVSPTRNYGFDRNIAMLGLKSTHWDMKNSIYDYYVADVMNAFYLQSEREKIFSHTEPWNLSAAFQYLREDSVGESLVGLSQTYLVGAKLGLHYENWTLSGIVTQIGNQTLLGSGNNYNQMGWSSFITFSDLQIDGESENAGALAYGGVLKRKFDESFEASLKYMHINQDDEKQSDVNSLTHNSRPDSDEYNLDASYKTSKSFKIRTRFAYIDYDPSSTELYKDRAFDEFNTRIILDFLF